MDDMPHFYKFQTHARDFPYRRIGIWRAMKKGEQTAEMARATAISNGLSVYGAPRILVVAKDMGFTGGDISEFLPIA